ncbi:MAG: MopE-related protein [Bradymonadia bacterium]
MTTGCQEDADPAASGSEGEARPPRMPEDDLTRRIGDASLPADDPQAGSGGGVGPIGGAAGGPVGGGAGGAAGAPVGGDPVGGAGGGNDCPGGGPETCDGADNDCDGTIDEGTDGGACSVGEGECAVEGTEVCAGGVLTCESNGAPGGGFETCDGLDNDCDGAVDEDFDDGRVCCTVDDHCPGAQTCVNRECSDGGGNPPPGGGGNPPPGGNPGPGCQGAQALGGPGSVFGEIGNEGTLAGSCSLLSGGEAVYTLQVNARQRVVADTAGSLVDTVLYVQTDCGNVLTEIACNDDIDGLFTPSEVDFVAEPGVTYSIVVDSLLIGGLYQLNVAYVPEDGGGGGNPPVDPPPAGADTCDTPTVLLNPGDYQGNTADNDPTHAGTCGRTDPSPEQAFLLIPDVTGEVTFTTTADFDTVMYVRGTCGDDASELDCDDDGGPGSNSALTFEAEAGESYYIVVDGYNGDSGPFTLRYEEAGAGPVDPPEEPVDPPPGGGDILCEGASILLAFGEEQGTTTGGASDLTGECAIGGPSPEQTWFFSVDVAQPVTIEVVDAEFDTVLYARTTCGDPVSEVACNDDGGDGLLSRMTFDAEPDTLYSVIVDGYNGANGAYTLSFSSAR